MIGFSYIAVFIAGEISFGQVQASAVVVSISSAIPQASFAMESMIDELAAKLGAKVGATRPLAEGYRWFPSYIEHRARAHWGEGRLLSSQGVLFVTPGADEVQGLPRLSGPDDRVADVIAFFERAQQQLAATGLILEGARLTPRGSWSLQLKGGARIMVGRSAAPEVRIARLVRVLPQLLEGEHRPFDRIDLRYTHGFAIAWSSANSGELPGSGAAVPAARMPGATRPTALAPSNPLLRIPGFST